MTKNGEWMMKTLASYYDESPTKMKTRYKIIKTGIELFSENGIEAVAMKDIADLCDITTRNLYRYYANKDLMVVDVAYYMFLLSAMDSKNRCQDEMSGMKALEAYIQDMYTIETSELFGLKLIKFILYFDLYLTKMSRSNAAYTKYTEVYLKNLSDLGMMELSEILIKGIEDGSIAIEKDEVEFYTEYIIQSLFSIVTRVLVKEEENPAINRRLIDKHIEIILAYLKG